MAMDNSNTQRRVLKNQRRWKVLNLASNYRVITSS